MNIELNNEQIYAVYDLENWWKKSDRQLFQISGAAGTGKTTLVRYLIERIGLNYDQVLFLAYMGKAASQLARNGLPAQTIHSAIYDYVKGPEIDENGRIVINEKTNRPKIVSKFVKKDKIKKGVKLIVVDEASMVSQEIAEDLMSFGIPIITLGDLNQLPPVYGSPYFLQEPDIILKQIMRQAEGDPIVWLSHEILAGRELKFGVYGNSAVIPKRDITEYQFKQSDIILTGTNRLRYNVNNFCREKIKGIKMLEYPHIGEKIICRKNNWDKKVDKSVYLTNGTTGFVDYIHRDSFNGKTMTMDFRPDFTKSVFKDITFDYAHMYEIPGKNLELTQEEQNKKLIIEKYNDRMEFAYAITVHSSQGSQWPNVLYLCENFMRSEEDNRKLNYTAITRASKSITIVI